MRINAAPLHVDVTQVRHDRQSTCVATVQHLAKRGVGDFAQLGNSPTVRQVGHAVRLVLSWSMSAAALGPRSRMAPSTPPRSVKGALSRSSGLMPADTAITSTILSSHHRSTALNVTPAWACCASHPAYRWW